MAKRSTQADLFKKTTSVYGGDHLKTRKGRAHGRPISTQHSMHFVLKSSLARGDWSFQNHKVKIREIIEGFAVKHGVRLNSMANVGNHLHLHLQLTSRFTYKPFIRAISAAIMMAVTGASRWQSFAQVLASKGLLAAEDDGTSGSVGVNNDNPERAKAKLKFWDLRPFSRIIISFKALLNLNDYIQINKHEGLGFSRDDSKFMVAWDRDGTRFAW